MRRAAITMTPRLVDCTKTEIHSDFSFRQHMGSSRAFGAFAPSLLPMEKINIKVPTMGDSITEGTIVEWTADIGQGVKEGDVVALVETDKVTVDIKAEVDGVVVTHYGAVDDTIEVGSDLYQIDTEAVPEQITPVANVKEDPPATVAETSTIVAESVTETEQVRTPSLAFLGKDGWAVRRSASEEQNHSGLQTIYVAEMDPMYGRTPITEEEMDALMLGGANLISDLKW